MRIYKPEKTRIKTENGNLYAIRIEVPNDIFSHRDNIRLIFVPRLGDKKYVELFFENIIKGDHE